MITFEKKTRLFHLRGKNYSYLMYVNQAGFLQALHYGGIAESDGEFFAAQGAPFAPDASNWNFDMSFSEMPSEYAFFAHGDFREPTAIVSREDGGVASRFRYVSHKIYRGVPEVSGMPHARSGGETLEITLKDDFSPAEIKLNYTAFEDSDVLVRNAEILNTGDRPFMLKRAFSFCTELPDGKFSLMRLHGTWGAERSPDVKPLGYGTVRLQSMRGTSSHQMNPFMGLLRANCTEDEGECYGFQLVYSGSFALTAEVSPIGRLRLQGGVNDMNFGWKLEAGERFVSPQTALCYSADGLGNLSREYADFLRNYVIHPDYAFRRRPVVVNHWEATEFNYDNEKLFEIIDAAKGLGIDTFVMDDGWFGARDTDFAGLGDWYVNEKKLKGGLKAVIDRCKKNGLKFGLWFEPEMVNEDSDLYRAHPDWAIHQDGVALCRARNQLVLDFTRKEVVDHIYEMMSKVLKENDIGYVKWDMNRHITENFSAALPPDRQGELMHRFTLGVYDLADRLTRAFPEILFEGCASGGGRFDSGMLYYFPQIWTSDDTDAYERAKIQWGTSICYPLSSMSCHVSVCPNLQTHRTIPFATRGAVASLGAFGYELNLAEMSAEERELTKKQTADYLKTDELILKGDLYRICSPFTDDWFCEMVVSKDKKNAYLVCERLRGVPLYLPQTVRLKGLDPEKKYFIEETKLTASGRTLMNHGIAIPYLTEYESMILHLREIK